MFDISDWILIAINSVVVLLTQVLVIYIFSRIEERLPGLAQRSVRAPRISNVHNFGGGIGEVRKQTV